MLISARSTLPWTHGRGISSYYVFPCSTSGCRPICAIFAGSINHQAIIVRQGRNRVIFIAFRTDRHLVFTACPTPACLADHSTSLIQVDQVPQQSASHETSSPEVLSNSCPCLHSVVTQNCSNRVVSTASEPLDVLGERVFHPIHHDGDDHLQAGETFNAAFVRNLILCVPLRNEDQRTNSRADPPLVMSVFTTAI